MTDAEYMKHIRNKLHLTQGEMAERLGYSSYVSISRIERKVEKMSPQVRKFLEYIEKHEL